MRNRVLIWRRRRTTGVVIVGAPSCCGCGCCSGVGGGGSGSSMLLVVLLFLCRCRRNSHHITNRQVDQQHQKPPSPPPQSHGEQSDHREYLLSCVCVGQVSSSFPRTSAPEPVEIAKRYQSTTNWKAHGNQYTVAGTPSTTFASLLMMTDAQWLIVVSYAPADTISWWFVVSELVVLMALIWERVTILLSSASIVDSCIIVSTI